MTTWTPIATPGSPAFNDATLGAILLESGYPDFLLQEDGFPPIRILLEGEADTTSWNSITTNTTVWTAVPT